MEDLAKDLAKGHDGKVDRVWTHALRAFSVRMKDHHAVGLSKHSKVKYVEENAPWYFSATHATNIDPHKCDPTTTTTCPEVTDNRLWHLDRIDQNSSIPSNKFAYANDGTGVTVYVVDAGVNKNHQEFAGSGRVQTGYNASGDMMPADDPCIGFAVPPVPNSDYQGLDAQHYRDEVNGSGHGIAVASVLGGRRIGVAKGVTIVPIKVNRCDLNTSRARLSNHIYQQHDTIFYSQDGAYVTRLYRALNTGQSGSAPPTTWPTSGTFQDNQVTWQFVPSSEWAPPEVPGQPLPSTNWLIDGLDWILRPVNPGPKSGAVVTMSVWRPAAAPGAAGATGTVESVIRRLLTNGLTVIASANNQNGDACDTSPARMSIRNPDQAVANNVITAGGSMLINRPWSVDISDAGAGAQAANGGTRGPEPPYVNTAPVRDGRWICGPGDSQACSNTQDDSTIEPGDTLAYIAYHAGSNSGPCVTLFAPAKNIFVASPSAVNGYRDARLNLILASGTSFSAPMVAGAAARILQQNPTYTAPDVRTALLNHAESVLDTATLPTKHWSTGQFITGTENELLRISNVDIPLNGHSTSFPAAVSGDTSLSVSANGPSLQYEWFRVEPDGFNLSVKRGAASSIIRPGTNSTFNAPADTTTEGYWARVTGTGGSADSDIAVVVPRPAAPSGLVAAASGTTVNLNWSASWNAERHELQRKVSEQPWARVGTLLSATATSASDSPNVPDGAVAYRVRAVSGLSYLPDNGLAATPSNNDIANVSSYLYETLPAPPSYATIKAQHVIDLRQAVNALHRIAEAVPLYTSTETQLSALVGQPVKADDLNTLMTRINNARALLGLPNAAFSGGAPALNGIILRSHLLSLRSAFE